MSKFLGVEPVCVRTHRQAFRLVNSIDISTIFDGAKAPTPYSRSAFSCLILQLRSPRYTRDRQDRFIRLLDESRNSIYSIIIRSGMNRATLTGQARTVTLYSSSNPALLQKCGGIEKFFNVSSRLRSNNNYAFLNLRSEIYNLQLEGCLFLQHIILLYNISG